MICPNCHGDHGDLELLNSDERVMFCVRAESLAANDFPQEAEAYRAFAKGESPSPGAALDAVWKFQRKRGRKKSQRIDKEGAIALDARLKGKSLGEIASLLGEPIEKFKEGEICKMLRLLDRDAPPVTNSKDEPRRQRLAGLLSYYVGGDEAAAAKAIAASAHLKALAQKK
jgi:hypothetical protein